MPWYRIEVPESDVAADSATALMENNIESVHKTDDFRTPKPRSQKSVFMGLSESAFGRVFQTLAFPAKCELPLTVCIKLASTLNTQFTHISSF